MSVIVGFWPNGASIIQTPMIALNTAETQMSTMTKVTPPGRLVWTSLDMV